MSVPSPVLRTPSPNRENKSQRLKVFESFLIIFKKATFQSVERMLMQTLCLSPHPSFGHPLQIGRGKYNLYKSRLVESFYKFLISQSDGARDKVCHPELVSGSELYAKHTSPYPVLDLLHAHGDSTKSLQLSRLVPFAIRTYFVSSVRKSASYLGEGIQVYPKAAL